MNQNFLFPNSLKKVGWITLIIGIVFGLFLLIVEPQLTWLEIKVFAIVDNPILSKKSIFSMVTTNIADEIASLALLFGAVLVAFSKEKIEDEFSTSLRLSSLVWATYVNLLILVLSILFFYGMSFFLILVINLFSTLLVFIVRYNFLYYKYSKSNEE
jgi:hypothetical protein